MSNLHFEQRETLAIIEVEALKAFLVDKYDAFIMNYKEAIRYVNNNIVIRCCDLLTLLINYKTESFVTYHQDQSK